MVGINPECTKQYVENGSTNHSQPTKNQEKYSSANPSDTNESQKSSDKFQSEKTETKSSKKREKKKLAKAKQWSQFCEDALLKYPFR